MDVDYYFVGPRFGTNNATVTIQFNESSREYGSLLSYNVTSPSQLQVAEIQAQEKTRFQIVIPYNTQVDVSFTARLCGQHNIPTVIQLFYSKSMISIKSQPIAHAYTKLMFLFFPQLIVNILLCSIRM